MAEASTPTCPTCAAPLPRIPRGRSKCRACANWIYPSFNSDFHSSLLTDDQHTATKALEFLRRRSPASARVVSEALPRLRTAQHDTAAMALIIRDLFIATAPRDDAAASEDHWHQCALFMAQLHQEFEWALRRSAESLLDRRLLDAILLGAYAGKSATEQDVLLTVCYQKDACGPCRSSGGYESGTSGPGTARFTIAEARERSILPHRGCLSTVGGVAGFCRCRYRPV